MTERLTIGLILLLSSIYVAGAGRPQLTPQSDKEQMSLLGRVRSLQTQRVILSNEPVEGKKQQVSCQIIDFDLKGNKIEDRLCDPWAGLQRSRLNCPMSRERLRSKLS